MIGKPPLMRKGSGPAPRTSGELGRQGRCCKGGAATGLAWPRGEEGWGGEEGRVAAWHGPGKALVGPKDVLAGF